jgi:ABC-type multidrug transport system fused ATPase/permease subunit
MIAHRPSTLASCDARIQLEDGAIVEASGTLAADAPPPIAAVDA